MKNFAVQIFFSLRKYNLFHNIIGVLSPRYTGKKIEYLNSDIQNYAKKMLSPFTVSNFLNSFM